MISLVEEIDFPQIENPSVLVQGELAPEPPKDRSPTRIHG